MVAQIANVSCYNTRMYACLLGRKVIIAMSKIYMQSSKSSKSSIMVVDYFERFIY